MAPILSSPAALAVAAALGAILRAFVKAMPGSAGLLLLIATIASYDVRLGALGAAAVLLVVDWRRST